MQNKTPNKKRRSGQQVKSPENLNFEKIIDSPGRSPSQGNLTGTARKVKDAAADWHNYVKKWDGYVEEGSRIISRISNIRLERVIRTENEQDATMENEMAAKLDVLCDRLVTIYEGMMKTVNRMDALTTVLNGVREFEKHQKDDTVEPMFLTWPAHKFYETSRRLCEMYAEEIKLKRTVMENIAHSINRDLLMFYSACGCTNLILTMKQKCFWKPCFWKRDTDSSRKTISDF